jgi:hypothetical protein
MAAETDTICSAYEDSISAAFQLGGEGKVLQSVNTAIKDWHVNIIRLPLAQEKPSACSNCWILCERPAPKTW